MSEGQVQEEIITARQLNNARNRRDKAELEYLKLVCRFQTQATKAGEEEEEAEKEVVAAPKKKEVAPKKRDKEEEEEEKVAPKKKEKKEKPEDWVCEGNLIDGTPCPLTAEAQEMSTDTRHLKKLHHTCKQCKKAMKKLKKAEKKVEEEKE